MMRVLCVLLLANGIANATDSVLLEFSQPGCGACRTMQPVITQLQREGVAVRQINAARETHLAHRYQISAVPTYIVLSDGREVTRLQGTQAIGTLRNALTERSQFQVTGAVTAEHSSTKSQLVSTSTPATSSATMEALPTMSLANAIERAQAATVRIRVQEGNGAVGIATGTVIDTHGEESLVLTCGHVFRETQGRSPIEVEVFAHGRIHKLPGQLVDYDADTRDIGLVSIRPGFPIEPVPVISQDAQPQAGSPAFSFGCDRGADPSRRDTRITAVNKYNQHIHASNLEIAGAPTIGRSGGGLFDHQGRLIGVCNAADFEDDIGIYTGPGSVHWQLDRVDLAHLYQSRQSTPPAPTRLVSNPATKSAPSTPPNDELIIILRDRSNPEAPPRVRTFHQAPAEIVRLLERG